MIENAIIILRTLKTYKRVTCEELAQKCGCCTRSVKRYINALICSGFDIDTKTGKGGGVFLREV